MQNLDTKELRVLVKQKVKRRETISFAIYLPLALVAVGVLTGLIPPSPESLHLKFMSGVVGALVLLMGCFILSAFDYRRRLATLRELAHTTPRESKQTTVRTKIAILSSIPAGLVLVIVGGVLPNHLPLLGGIVLILFGTGLCAYEKWVVATDEEMEIIRRLN